MLVPICHGLVANNEMLIPFTEMARINMTSGAYRDGFGSSGIEIWTRGVGVDATDITTLWRVVGIRAPAG